MITAYIPFLPLERRHIRECIKDFLVNKRYYRARRDIPDSVVREVSEQLHYYPDDLQVFSVTGCKRVPEKVDYVMISHEELWEQMGFSYCYYFDLTWCWQVFEQQHFSSDLRYYYITILVVVCIAKKVNYCGKPRWAIVSILHPTKGCGQCCKRGIRFVTRLPNTGCIVEEKILTLETGISANFDVKRNVIPPLRIRRAHSGSNSPMTSQNINAKQCRKVASGVRFFFFLHILHIFRQEWEK